MCNIKTVKILLILFNVFFWVLGLGILAVGLWIKIDTTMANLGKAIQIGFPGEPVVEIVTWLFIGAGIFVFTVGFFGCCGAIHESKIMLGFYMVCIVIVFMAEVGAGAYAVIRKDQIKTNFEINGRNWIRKEYDARSNISQGLNYVQFKFDCCGVNNYMDYYNSTHVQNQVSLKKDAYISFACCKESSDSGKLDVEVSVSATTRTECMNEAVEDFNSNGTCLDPQKYKNFHCKGCLQSVEEWANENMVIFGVVGIVIGVLQVILFVIALIFCRLIDREDVKY